MTDQDFEDCSLWPIRIHIRQGAGYTLWGSGGGELDLLLAVEKRLRAFNRWPAVVEFVHDGTACNLSLLSGYQILRERMERPGHRVPESVREYPLAEVGSWLRTDRPRWTTEMRSATIDCLNLLWDAAGTLGDEPTRTALRGDSEPLGRLMNGLTFAGDHDSPPIIAAALASGAADEYHRVLDVISAQWDLVP